MSKLSITVVNDGDEAVEVDWEQSSVKVKGGTYRTIGGGRQTCPPHQSVSTDDSALFGAGANRRYRIHTQRNDNDAVKYYPSESSYTDDPTPVIHVS